MKDKEAIVIFEFESGWAGEDEYPYFGKSWHLIINKRELDFEDWVSEDMLISKKISNVMNKYYNGNPDLLSNGVGNTAFYSKKNGPLHYSDHIFEKLGEGKNLYIIYKFKGDVLEFKRMSAADLARKNHRYSCPIEEDLLNVPFFYVVAIDSFYPIDNNFLRKNNFIKAPVDSFMINFCD